MEVFPTEQAFSYANCSTMFMHLLSSKITCYFSHMKISLFSLVFLPLAVFAQTFSVTVNQPIPDDGTPALYDLAVSGLPNEIDTSFGVETVCINLTHSWNADLFITLVAPDGTEVELTSDNGGDSDNYTQTCFNAGSALGIWEVTGPFTGTYRPEGFMTLLNNGQNPNGTWQLKILDTYAFADTGVMLDWSLTFGENPAQPFPFYTSTLPILKINTGGKVIRNEQKITANLQVINHGNGQIHYLADPPNEYDGDIAIELRGNSSLWMPKKSFGLETRLPDSTNNNVSLLGMPAENDWVLLANYSDKSLMRNYLSQELYQRTGRYGPRMRFCELVIDGEYRGIYLLGERIKRDSSRVDIANLNPDENSGEELTGGYIIKADWTNGSNVGGFSSQFYPLNNTQNKLYYQFHYPQADEISMEQSGYIAAYVDSFEQAINSADFQDPVMGWRRFADEASFIDYILLYEFTNNVDAYWLSMFLHKDKNGKLKAGPPWDFDLAWSNANYSDGWNSQIWRYEWLANNTDLLPFYYKKIWDDTTFTKHAACRWKELREGPFHTDSLHALMNETYALLSGPQVANFTVWDIIGIWVWPNVDPPATEL